MKNRLSYSAIEKYLSCPKEYYLHYVAKLRDKMTSSALLFGSAIDNGLNALVMGKPDYYQIFLDSITNVEINGNKEKLPGTDKVRFFKSDIDYVLLPEHMKFRYTKEQVQDLLDRKNYHTEDETKEFNEIAYQCILTKGQLIFEAYKTQVMPLFKRVISVQKAFSLSNDDGDEFIGFIDLTVELHDGRIVVFDNKTTSVKYEENSVKESKQLATYVIAEGNDSTLAGFIAIHKKILKKEPRVKIQVIIDNVDESVIDLTFENYDLVNQKIKEGEFPQNFDSCNRPWGRCPMYELCHNNDMSQLVDTTKVEKNDS